MIAYTTAELTRQALDKARPTLGEIADRLGVSKPALEKYREGTRPTPLPVRLRLAALLEAQAAELQTLAGALRETGEE